MDVGISKREISGTTNTKSWAGVGDCVAWPKRRVMNTNLEDEHDELLLLPELDSYQFTGTELVWSFHLGLRVSVRTNWRLRFLDLDL